MKKKKKIRLLVIAGFVLVAFLVVFKGWPSDPPAKEKFNAGELVMHHIKDNHEWQIFGDFYLSLPVILIDEGKFVLFMSSKLHDGQTYMGYKLGHGKKNAGKIVREGAGGSEIVPLDFSITKNVLSVIIGGTILCLLLISVAKRMKRREGKPPKGFLQNVVEMGVEFVKDLAKENIGDRYEKFLSLLLTLFFLIFFMNLLGTVPVFPGGANVSGNIAFTASLALIVFIVVMFQTNKGYWGHIVNIPGAPWWTKFPIPLLPAVEIMGIFLKPLVLAVRLFANMMAGHITVLVLLSLIFIFGEKSQWAPVSIGIPAVIVTVALSVLELLIAFLQAYVFTMLSAMYIGAARVEHEHEHTETISSH